MKTTNTAAQVEALNSYEQQAIDFLKSTNTDFKAEFMKNDFHFDGDEHKRDIYKITLKRGSRQFSFNFGQSIAKSQFYQDTLSKRKYTTNGKGIDNTYRITTKGLIDFCKLHNGTPPGAYDVLACLQKNDIGSFEDFCSEFGYDTYSKKAEKTYKAVCKEYESLCRLYSDDELQLMTEIN